MKAWLVAIAACSAPAPAPVHNTAPAPPQPVLVLRMERTECFGGCPTYSVEIANTGRVRWHGEDNVLVVGDALGQITQADVERLVTAFDRAGFFKLVGPAPRFHEDCTSGRCITIICGSTDAPTTRVTIVRDNQPHTYEAPACDPAIDRAEDLVDAVVGTKTWIGAPTK